MFGTLSMTVLMAPRVYNRHNRELRIVSAVPGAGPRSVPVSGNSTNPGIYPGNPSLPREVRDKILSTFKHTLSLFQEGKTDDCLIGCDFILKMDPRFSPARRLLEKAKNPAAEVDLIELEAIVAGAPARAGKPAPADAEKLLVRAVESYNARDFDACINAAEQVLTALPGNVHAAELIEKSKKRKEAAADFEGARTRALALLEARRYPDALRELGRMRALDPEHPAVSLLERRLKEAGVAPAVAEPELGGMMDLGEHAGFGPSDEPHISFDAPQALATSGGGLDSLSLDSLSLDAPTAVAPPPNMPSTRKGPLDRPASPGDLWSESPEPAPAAAPLPTGPRRAPAEEDPGRSEREVANLLRQGDEAAARGDHEGAIEIWSRIFLIDINSVEAVTRIEKTRQVMAEGDQRLGHILKKGQTAFDAGDLSGARAAYLEALSIDGGNATAREALDRIEKELAEVPAELPADIAAPAEEDMGLPVEQPEEAAAPKKRGGLAVRVPPRVALIGAVFVVLVGFGAWLVLRQPKPSPTPAVQEVAGARLGGSLEKATAFFQEGKIPETLAELKRIRPSDPDYAKAKQLLETLSRPTSEAPPPAAGAAAGSPASSDAGDPAPIRTRAERALGEKRYIDALKDFSAVSSSFQGDSAFSQSMASASEHVAELTPAVKLYNEGEYETAIPVLWRIYQSDKGNQDARSYLLRCYTNQGITQLQNGLYPKAKQSFDEALALDPEDTELQRHRKFSERYQKGDLDLLGRIYVRHLSHRP
jgi:tetratricopeptide (TPR) repeat protein